MVPALPAANVNPLIGNAGVTADPAADLTMDLPERITPLPLEEVSVVRDDELKRIFPSIFIGRVIAGSS